MKKILPVLLIVSLLMGLFATVPYALTEEPAGETLDSHLITHWNFAGEKPLEDKGTASKKNDVMQLFGSSSLRAGSVYIPDWGNKNSEHWIAAEDSGEMMRSPEDRTFFIVFKSDKGPFDPNKQDRMELVSQNGAFRVGIGKDNKVFCSTNPHSMGENWAMTNGMNTFSANTWTTVAISYKKEADGKFTVDSFFNAGDGKWVSGTAQKNDPSQTWLEDNSDDGKQDTNDLRIGRLPQSNASTWGGNLTVDDIRIYDCALNLDQVKSIQVTDEDPVDLGVTLKGHSLTLEGDIGINFFITPSDVLIGNGEVQLIQNGQTVKTVRLNTVPAEADGSRRITANVSAKEMTDEITLNVQYQGKTVFTDKYSVAEYGAYIQGHSAEFDGKTVNLVRSMLNYGGYAQIYFQYHTDRLANAGLNLPLKDVVKTEVKGAKVSGSAAGLTYYGVTLALNSKINPVFAFKVDGIDPNTVTVEGCECAVTDGGKYLQVKAPAVMVQSLDQAVSLNVNGLEITYVPMDCVMNLLDSKEESTVNLMKALYAYCQDAKAVASAE